MKKIFDWQIVFAFILILLSVIFYFLHYFIFHDIHHIFLYLIGDIAFVFLEVLLVTLVIHKLLHYREKKSMLKKLNMVIGAFFSEIGLELLKTFEHFSEEFHDIKKNLNIDKDTNFNNFKKIKATIRASDFSFDIRKIDIKYLKKFLIDKRDFLLRLLENPNLLEHESFTNLLWAVFHFTEELSYRNDLSNLPETDYQHLSGDLKRIFYELIIEWLSYIEHLKNNYPYLFSLAIRTNPFNPNASVIIENNI